ncbi:MAG: ubiquinol-cytochrome C reductase [Alphaproteobacteria bacterium]|nr:MAG: ubiquinol-cytochrome C reductase [Alphaproteobacteria bacterium]
MQYWLIKSEPYKWSWDDQVQKGVEHWDGVRNYQASNNMKAMELGDLAFFYHSNEGKEIVGIVEVVKLYYPDHTDPKGRFGMVDFKAVRPIKRFVTLAEIKADPNLEEMALVKQSRLSVAPVREHEWNYILNLAEG